MSGMYIYGMNIWFLMVTLACGSLMFGCAFLQLSLQIILVVIFYPCIFFSCSEKMINLFKVKAKQRETAENANGKPPVKKQTAGELRLHKGIMS